MVLTVYKGPQIWQTLPTDLRNSEALSNVLKSNMKKSNNKKPNSCLGYVDHTLAAFYNE